MNSNILDTITKLAIKRMYEAKKAFSPEMMRNYALSLPAGQYGFKKLLTERNNNSQVKLICELKKASPLKGVIDPLFDYISIAKEYETAGADAVSVITEPGYYLGSIEAFRQIRKIINLPMLRKDFIVDEFQIYESKVIGADAVLIIVAITAQKDIERYLNICRKLGISAVVEVHDESELKKAVLSGADIIAVNNRNLNDFSLDMEKTGVLGALMPKSCVFIAESGFSNVMDIKTARVAGAAAVTVGEAVMTAWDRISFIKGLRTIV